MSKTRSTHQKCSVLVRNSEGESQFGVADMSERIILLKCDVCQRLGTQDKNWRADCSQCR
jgi:hypothetical protein